MEENKMTDSDTNALVVSVPAAELALWSEDKRREFTKTFEARVRAARFILIRTAVVVAQIARQRHFIGAQHYDRLFPGYGTPNVQLDDFVPGCRDVQRGRIGGRIVQELQEIAESRADAVLKSLPPIRDAINVVDVESAKLMDRLDVLREKGQKLTDELELVTEPIVMQELDQSMTIGNFRALVKARNKRRLKLLEDLQEIGEEGCGMEVQLNKRLYRGLPGLADAVVQVVQQHLDRAKALDATSRRVGEQVIFGDSEAALELLRHFEADEATISSSVKEGFDQALAKLKVSIKSIRDSKRKSLKKAQP